MDRTTTATPSRCGAQNAAGKPCGAAPLKGRDRCLAHSDAETRGSVGFSPEAGKLGGRPRNPRPSEVARQLIEENVLALQRPYWLTLGFDVEIGDDGPHLVKLENGGAKLHASFEGRVRLSDVDDLGAMITAAEKLQDRVYGRPTQATEISGPDGGPVALVNLHGLTDEALKELAAAVGVTADEHSNADHG